MRSTAWDLGGKVRFRFAPLRMTRARVISDAVPDCYRERKQKRASRFILSLVDPDAPPYGFASLFEFGYGLRPPLRMTRGSFGKTTIGERALSYLRWRAHGRGASYTSSTAMREPPKLGKLVSGNPAAVPLVSLRLGHARVLIVHRTIIHYARAASLPQGEGFRVSTLQRQNNYR